MATRTSQLDEMGNIDAVPGTRDWAVGVLRDAQSTLNDANAMASHLRVLMTLMKQHNAHQVVPSRNGQPFMTWDQFCSTPYPWGLGLASEEVDAIVAASDGSTVGAVLRKRGRPKKGEEKPSDRRFKYGDNSEYYLARLERDRPDLVRQLNSGEIASIR